MERRPGLDTLRATAIVWVMAFHSYIVIGTAADGAVLRWSGWMGVDLFFALSGFLIGSQVLAPLSRGERLSFSDFYLRRAFRILPAYGVVLVAYFFWPVLREAPGIRPVWQFLTFTMNLLGAQPSQRAFSHAWSLCVEEHFYLLFPVLAWAMTRRPSLRRFLVLLAGLVMAGMVVRGWLWVHEVEPARLAGGPAGQRYLQYLYNPTWARLDDLLAGVALAALRCYRGNWWTWLQARANTLAVLGVGIVGGCMALFHQQRMTFMPNVVGDPLLALGMMCLVCSAASTQGVLGRWRVPGAQWLALTSYSLYLTHKAVYGLIHTYLHRVDGHGAWTFLVYAVAVLGVVAVLHYTVERPFLRLRRHVLAARLRSPGASMPASATMEG